MHRSGAALIEMALTALILLIIIFGGIEYGRMVFGRQFAGEGARVAAKEAATKPGAIVLPPNAQNIFVDPQVFNERFTVIDLGNLRFPTGAALTDQNGDAVVNVEDQFIVLPPVHSTLRSVMFQETRIVAGVPRNLLRLKGVLLRNPTAPFDLIVRIPDTTPAPAFLHRAIEPPLPADAMLTGQNLVRIECWQWFDFAVWPFGGAGLPALAFTNFPLDPTRPPGQQLYNVVINTDLDPTTRQARFFRSYAIARKHVQ